MDFGGKERELATQLAARPAVDDHDTRCTMTTTTHDSNHDFDVADKLGYTRISGVRGWMQPGPECTRVILLDR